MSKMRPEDKSTSFAILVEQSCLPIDEISARCVVTSRTVYRWIKDNSAPPLAVAKLQQIVKEANKGCASPFQNFKYIDLFAGIGGFRRAFDSIGGKCVFTSEWDKACRLTYTSNYTCDHPVNGDIRDYTINEDALAMIPQHDVIVAGFPCQPFSLAGVSKKNSLGKQHGFKCETQGTLFFDLAQIIEFHKPKAFLLENVKNLISHDGGNTFRIIKNTLENELGYTIKYKVIDGRSWVPQHRERIFIVGFRENCDFSFDTIKLPENTPTLANILHECNPFEIDEHPYCINGAAADKYTLSSRLWEYLQQYKKKHLEKGNGFGFGLFSENDVARTLSARYYKDGSEILISRGKRKRPRRLTPRECARIMGYDGHGENNFQIPVSDTQAYRQFGNSVIVPVATAVATAMKPFILAACSKQHILKERKLILTA